MSACPECRTQVGGRLFPALHAPAAPLVQRGEAADEGEASCFFHPAKKAALACERCGRFICALCEVKVGSVQVCPTCFDQGLRSDKMLNLVTSRICWPNSAFLAGWLPFLIFPLWPLLAIAGPAAIFAALYGWKKPGSLVRGRRRWMAILGLLGGLMQIALFLGVVWFIWRFYPHA